MMRVNIRGPVLGARVFARRMIETGKHGAIVNVASGAAYVPIPLSSLYCTTKAAVKAASDCLHIELAQHGISVTAICPGMIDTAFYEDVRHVGIDPDEAASRRSLITGLSKRIAHDPDVVARAIVAASVKGGATRPAGFEAHIGYALSRISPESLRLAARFLKADTLVGFANTSLPAPVRAWIGGTA
jgi:short-subunit dehydrogenase